MIFRLPVNMYLWITYPLPFDYSTFINHNTGDERTIITLQNSKMGAYPFKTISQIPDYKPVDVEYAKK